MPSELGLGLVLPMIEDPQSGEKPPWVSIKRIALRAETIGFDTVWVPDELLGRAPDEWAGRASWRFGREDLAQGRIPLMLGAHGPRTMRLAAKHADIWSSFAMESSRPEWFGGGP